MARARNIKPGLFINELLGDKDPLLTLLFIGLWTLADREGKLEYIPLRIKAQIFPYRESLDINGYLTELASLEFVDVYSHKNRKILRIKNFKKHQSPHKTEKASELPDPDENSQTIENTEKNSHIKQTDTKITVNAPLNNGSLTENATGCTDSLIPDSLIPDSLIQQPCDNSASVSRLPDAKEISIYLAEKIKTENPKAKLKPAGWEKEIDLAMRIDKRTKDDLFEIIDWIYSAGSFWKPHILSGKKLRDKFDTMSMQSKKVNGSNQPLPRVVQRKPTANYAKKDFIEGECKRVNL